MSDASIVQVNEDGSIIYRASALGHCLTALAAARQQLVPQPPPAKLQEIFDAGHDTEARFTEHFPDVITGSQMEVSLALTRRISIVGHIDGLYGSQIAEIKSQSENQFEAWTPAMWTDDNLWWGYSWQVSCYMLALNRELALFRVSRENVERFEVWVVERPFWTLDDIRNRVLEVETLARQEEPLKCSINEWGCPYSQIHVDHQMVSDRSLLEAVDSYIKAGDDEKFAKEIRALARGVFMGYFDEYKTDKIITPLGVKLSRSEFDRKEKVIPAGHEVRVTVTLPKGEK